MKNLKEYIFKNILPNVEKPARYTGGEFNIAKTKENPEVTFAFCFPDTYEIGMSHLGMKLLYEILNSDENIMCERVFAPATDMIEQMKENNIPLFSLETFTPLCEFNFVGFTMQYEMSYTTVLLMLDLAGIPFYAKDRDNSHPLVVAGGPCMVNPEPVADFFDMIFIGEGEELNLEVLNLYRKIYNGKNKEEFLIKASEIEGVYVPNIEALKGKTVQRRIVKDFENAQATEKPIVPFIAPAHDRIALEVMRGCKRGCRFCQAGIIYRPVRERSLEKLQENTANLIKNTGYEEISLSSLSTTDYSGCMELSKYIVDNYKKDNVNLSLPSLRMDDFSLDLLKQTGSLKKGSMTFAPEAGSQKIRNVINKNLTEEQILETAKKVFQDKYSKLKLYFMLGLPFEDYEDLDAIADLCNKIISVYYSIPKQERGRPFAVTISTSCFVPKAWTPFQWFGQDNIELLNKKQKYLKSKLPKQVKYNYHDADLSMLEAIFARGERFLSEALVKAYKKGCFFDSWYEHFNLDAWLQTFEEINIDPYKYASRNFSKSTEFPWDFIDIGVSKDFLWEEWNKAKDAVVTPDCSHKCSNCGITRRYGICKFTGGSN